MKSVKQILDEKGVVEKNKHITREFQDFAYRLAAELNDLDHRGIYMRLAKTIDRSILEACRRFVIDSRVDNKGALFMWKLKQLRKQSKELKIEVNE